MEMVELEKLENPEDIADLKAMITEHKENTQSDVAAALLADWPIAQKRFVKVMPVDYKRMQSYMDHARSTNKFETEYDVAVEAFDMHLENLAAQKA